MPRATIEPISCSPELGGLAGAIRRRIFGSRLEALLGIRQLTPARDGPPPAGEPCLHCGAVRDPYGVVLWSRTVFPATGLRLTRPTGIQEGDPLACPVCDALNPAQERRGRHHAKPPRVRSAARAPAPKRLTAKERRSLSQEPRGRAWVAMIEAEGRGDRETAGRLQTALYRLDDGLIDLDELARLTDTTLDVDSPTLTDVNTHLSPRGDKETFIGVTSTPSDPPA